MGAWGEKPFQNDAALDFLAEVGRGGADVLRGALSTAATAATDDYLEVDDGSAAIAAAEMVAAALGEGRERLVPEAVEWLDANPGVLGEPDRVLAARAVQRALAAEGSELAELWGEETPLSDWHRHARALLARLGGDPPPVTEKAPSAGTQARTPEIDFAQMREGLGALPEGPQKQSLLELLDATEAKLSKRAATTKAAPRPRAKGKGAATKKAPAKKRGTTKRPRSR